MTPLEQLLETLDGKVSPDDPPFLVAAFGAPHQGGLLVTDDDLSHLLGWRVPDGCWAVGLVGGATQIPYDIATPRRRRRAGPAEGAPGDEPGALRLCCLVARDGAVASLLRGPDGAVMASGEAEGRVVDALRRTLDLPTPPPERGTADLLAVLWLEDLLAAADSGAALGWPEAAALHPAMRVLATEGHDIALEHITMIARVATAAWSWENLRLQACQENCLSDLVPAELAEWMDVGMFSRWLQADLPAVPSASSRLGRALGPAVWQEVQAVIQATGATSAGVDDEGPGSPLTSHRDGCLRRAAPEPGPRPRAMPCN